MINDLVLCIDEIFLTAGFRKKGKSWLLDNGTLIKMISIEKSNYGNSFYINYGYIIKSIPLDLLFMHLFYRLPETSGIDSLKDLLRNKVLGTFKMVNSEEDILVELKKLPHLNAVPLVVKKHFHLDE